jgi:hypothetical protein
MDPTLSDPIPELIHYLPVRILSYPNRSRSLYLFYPTVSDPIRSDAEAYTSSPGMDPILSEPIPQLMSHSSGMVPTRSDPIPKLTHILPKWTRPYPTRYRSLYIIFRCGSDPIRSEAGAYTSFTRVSPIPSHLIPEFVHYLRKGSDPIRSDTEAYAPSSGMDPILSDPIPGLRRNGSDPIRSDPGSYTSSSGMDPTLSDPLPELMHYLPVWSRSYPIRSLSLHTIFRNGPDPIRPDTEAYTVSSGVEPILSDPILELVHPLPG